MGLRVSHDCFCGPYGLFGDFRRELARAALIPLPLMEGYFGHEPVPYRCPMQLVPFLPIRWEALRFDPLHVLLTHPDNEGTIERDDQLPLAFRLRSLAPRLRIQWRPRALAFAEGLERAHEAGETVVFS